MTTEVSFTANAGDLTDQNPGEALARSLSKSLLSRGYETSAPENIDYAFAFRCRVRTRDFYLLVGYVGDSVREWLISANSGLSWLKRFFGVDDTEECRDLLCEIHEILSSAEDVADIRWYTADDWKRDRNSAWVSAPKA